MEKNEKKQDQVSVAKPYPQDVYLVADEKGVAHFYHDDPMNVANRTNGEMDLGQEIFEFMEGASDIVNPILVRFMAYRVKRGVEFDMSKAESIRRNELDAHIQDLEGNVVEITSRLSNDEVFPLNGIIYDENGHVKESRCYSADGSCSDGKASHRIITMKGRAVFDE